MPLRHSPRSRSRPWPRDATTPVSQPARRPSEVKPRASLNALKHGPRYAAQLRRQLVEAGDRQGEALYARIEAQVREAFCSSGSPRPTLEAEQRQVRRLTGLFWCFAARRQAKGLPCPKTNLECALESEGLDARDLSQGPILVQDGRRRIGLVFWRQRRRMRPGGPGDGSFNEFWKRFGNGFRRLTVALDRSGFGAAGAEGAGPGRIGPQWTGAGPSGPWWACSQGKREGTGEGTGEMGFRGSIFEHLTSLAGLGEWEAGWRSRIFHLRQPNIWARLHYGVDRDGVYSPQIEARGRRELKKLCLAGIAVSSWPSVMDERLVPDPTLIPYGFETVP